MQIIKDKFTFQFTFTNCGNRQKRDPQKIFRL